jgi:tRNA 2-thiocytidine biosynthesis protein TtcA
LFKAAVELGCSKIALGHHADDLAETTLPNLVFNGRVETMAPKSSYFDNLFFLIRALCYIFDKRLRKFAGPCDFPPPPSICPNSGKSKREKAASIIHEVEHWGTNFRVNLMRTGLKGIGIEDKF